MTRLRKYRGLEDFGLANHCGTIEGMGPLRILYAATFASSCASAALNRRYSKPTVNYNPCSGRTTSLRKAFAVCPMTGEVMSGYTIEKTSGGYVVAVDGIKILKTGTRRAAVELIGAARSQLRKAAAE